MKKMGDKCWMNLNSLLLPLYEIITYFPTGLKYICIEFALFLSEKSPYRIVFRFVMSSPYGNEFRSIGSTIEEYIKMLSSFPSDFQFQALNSTDEKLSPNEISDVPHEDSATQQNKTIDPQESNEDDSKIVEYFDKEVTKFSSLSSSDAKFGDISFEKSSQDIIGGFLKVSEGGIAGILNKSMHKMRHNRRPRRSHDQSVHRNSNDTDASPLKNEMQSSLETFFQNLSEKATEKVVSLDIIWPLHNFDPKGIQEYNDLRARNAPFLLFARANFIFIG